MDNSGFTTPGNFETIAVDTAIGLTAAKIAVGRDTMAWIGVETDAVRIRFDGQSPADGEGILVPVETNLVIAGKESLNNLRMIKVTGTASVKVQYFHAL